MYIRIPSLLEKYFSYLMSRQVLLNKNHNRSLLMIVDRLHNLTEHIVLENFLQRETLLNLSGIRRYLKFDFQL